MTQTYLSPQTTTVPNTSRVASAAGRLGSNGVRGDKNWILHALAQQYFLAAAYFSTHRVGCCAPPHQPSTPARHPSTPLNLHRACVRRNHGAFLQVIVSKARNHTKPAHPLASSRFRCNTRTSRPLSGENTRIPAKRFRRSLQRLYVQVKIIWPAGCCRLPSKRRIGEIEFRSGPSKIWLLVICLTATPLRAE